MTDDGASGGRGAATIRTVMVGRTLSEEELEDSLDATFEVVAACRSGREALRVLAERSVDLLITEVHLVDIDAFDLLAGLDVRDPPEVLLVADSDRYTLAAFDAGVLDYVLRPLTDDRLEVALSRAAHQVRLRRLGLVGRHLTAILEELSDPPEDPDEVPEQPLTRLVARSGANVEFIPVERIHRITAEDYYVRVHTPGGTHLLRESLKRLEKRLPADLFVRAHRSVIVNVRWVRSLIETPDGRKEAVMEDGTHVPVARARTSSVVQAVARSP